jgi:hypothetical protein
MNETPAPLRNDAEAPPPLLGSWRAIYLLVLGELAALVVLFVALTWWSS